MNVPMLQPAQFFEQRQHRPHHRFIHMQLGNITDMAMVVGFLWETLPHLRVIFGQGGDRSEKFQN